MAVIVASEREGVECLGYMRDGVECLGYKRNFLLSTTQMVYHTEVLNSNNFSLFMNRIYLDSTFVLLFSICFQLILLGDNLGSD